MDSLDIILSALVLGASTGIKDTSSQVIKDLYSALRQFVITNYGEINLRVLEENPESNKHCELVKENLKNAGAENDSELIVKAEEFIIVINEYEPEIAKTVGVRLSRFKAASIDIGSVTAEGSLSTGVIIEEAEISDSISIKKVHAKDQSNSKKK